MRAAKTVLSVDSAVSTAYLSATRVPKPKNSVPSVTVTFTTTPQVKSLLARLVEGGLYGKNAAEAAERLVARSLEQMVVDGALKAPTPQPLSDTGGRTSSGAGKLTGSSD